MGEVYPSPAESLPRNQQLAGKPQFYLTSYRYTFLPQARAACRRHGRLPRLLSLPVKINLGSKIEIEVDIFLILCLGLLQGQKAIFYQLQ